MLNSNFKKTTRLFILAGLCGLLFIQYGCPPTDIGDQTIGVSGTVFDAASTLPLEEAWVNFADSATPFAFLSDSAGFFQYVTFGNPPQSIQLYFGKEGYVTFDTIIDIPSNTRFVDSVEIYLTPVI